MSSANVLNGMLPLSPTLSHKGRGRQTVSPKCGTFSLILDSFLSDNVEVSRYTKKHHG